MRGAHASWHVHAAIHVQRLPGNVGRRGRAEESYRGGDVFARAKPSHRNLRKARTQADAVFEQVGRECGLAPSALTQVIKDNLNARFDRIADIVASGWLQARRLTSARRNSNVCC